MHADIGSGDVEATAALARWLAPAMTHSLAPGAVVVSDQRLSASGLCPLPLPEDVDEERYFMARWQNDGCNGQ